jgi:hypothetical protein
LFNEKGAAFPAVAEKDVWASNKQQEGLEFNAKFVDLEALVNIA